MKSTTSHFAGRHFLLWMIGMCTLLSMISCHTTPQKDSAITHTKDPIDFLYAQRAYPTGKIKADARKQAVHFKRSRMSSSRRPLAVWEFAGPINIGGRVTDIEIPADDERTYFVGAASGGIFKTEDDGESWIPIFDEQGSLSIGDIEISQNNTDIVWVGTGEPNAGGGSLTYDGDGVYSSDDGGLTWTSRGLRNTGNIARVALSPTDDSTVYVAAMGGIFSDDSNRGVYRSIDNGENWEQVLFLNDSTGAIDLEVHPQDGNLLYAAMWQRVRRPQYREYGGQSSGIYRSVDGGETWTELTNGLPSDPLDKGRISLAISQSNPDVLYTRYADARGFMQGIYRTEDGGDTWEEVNSEDIIDVSFHWWFRGIEIDPTDENTIYSIDFLPQKSTDGGQTWQNVFLNTHVDQHAIAFSPSDPDVLLLGHDGGVDRSKDGGTTYTKFLNLPITQFYRVYADPQDLLRLYGGTQDNSTMRTITGSEDDWVIFTGGDGFQPLVDPNEPTTIYALSQRGNLIKSTDDTESFATATDGIEPFDRFNWDTPIAFDPQDSETLFYGSQRMYKTTDGAANWSPISPDLTNGDGGGNLSFGTITTIDVSPLDSDVLLAGTDDSNVWISQDGGENWTEISESLPMLWTTKVLADREDLSTVYVTFSGYRYATNTSHVFVSRDAGETWEDIGSDLPDIPVNDIVKDQFGNLYIATDVGVFASEDEGENWLPFGENMPDVVVTDLHIHEGDQVLIAGTYGRSMYTVEIGEAIVSAENNIEALPVAVFPNPAREFVEVRLEEESVGSNLEIFDALGRQVHQGQAENAITRVSVEGFRSGYYYLRISGNGRVGIEKFLVKK